MPSDPYDIVFDSETEKPPHAIDRKFHGLIRQAIDKQLQYQAEVETKNRKRLREPAAFGATWEIRFGSDNRFRVLYRIESPLQVVVVAIGTKQRNRLWVGEKGIQL